MITRDILNNNLNDKVTYDQFFRAFGYEDSDRIYLRWFYDPEKRDDAGKDTVYLSTFDTALTPLHRCNDRKFGIFYVVNGGGHSDPEVKKTSGPARAQFMEIDPDDEDLQRVERGEISLEDLLAQQVEKIAAFPLEPSVIVMTRKSLHVYWILKNGDIKRFRALQQRLVQHFKSDRRIINESRVMRIYGFYHQKKEPVLVRLIKFDPDLRYTQDQLDEVLPALDPTFWKTAKAATSTTSTAPGELVPIGQRHGYVMSRIGYMINKIGDTATDEMIYALIEADYRQNCEGAEDTDFGKFRTSFLKAIADIRAKREAEDNDPTFWSYARKAWKEENPGKEFDSNETSWDEVADAGRRAKEAGLTFDKLQFTYNGKNLIEKGEEDPSKQQTGLYNVKDLRRAISDGFPVYLVGDTQDMHGLRTMGLTSTALSGPWDKALSSYFVGARLRIVPDNSPEAENQARRIKKDLKQWAFSVAIVEKVSADPGGNVSECIAHGVTQEDLKEKLKSAPADLASWAYTNDRGNVNISPSVLASNFSKVVNYVIVRNPVDDNDLFYGYRHGVYCRWNKAQVKAALRKFVPLTYQKDGQIAEAQRTTLELDDKILTIEDLNSDERYINFKNGLYDLQKRELVPHTPDLISTIQLGFDYDPEDQERPVFSKFMDDLFTKEDGTIDTDSMKILQEFCGLAISNVYVYRVKKALFLCSLRGNTGKSVLMNLLQYIIGEDNVTSVPIQNMNESSKFAMGTILGKRMIINGDQTESDISDSSYFKQLTGGDRTKMEGKGKQPVMIRYRGGIMVGCNGLPSFTDDKGEHIFERLLLIMCNNVIPEEKRDSSLLDKMKTEAPAIINYFLEGLHRLIDNDYKFTRSEATVEAAHQYREQLDSVYRFIHEYTEDGYYFEVTHNPLDQVAKNRFYEAYVKWCYDPENELRPIRKKNLNQRLDALGLDGSRKGWSGSRRGIYTIKGLRWTDGTEDKFIPFDEWFEEYKKRHPLAEPPV